MGDGALAVSVVKVRTVARAAGPAAVVRADASAGAPTPAGVGANVLAPAGVRAKVPAGVRLDVPGIVGTNLLAKVPVSAGGRAGLPVVVPAPASGSHRAAPLADEATRPPWLIRRPVELLMKRFVRRGCGLVVEGRDLVPKGAFIVCTNHRSHVDSVVIMTAFGIGFEACGLVAATDYFFAGWRRRLMVSSVFAMIPVERAATVGSFRRSIEACGGFLRGGGQAIVMYPEGSRSRDGRLAPFKRGPAALALALGLPIVPGFIAGSDQVLPKGRWRAVRAPLTLRLGEALLPAAFVDPRTRRGCSRAMTVALEVAIAGLGRSGAGTGGELP